MESGGSVPPDRRWRRPGTSSTRCPRGPRRQVGPQGRREVDHTFRFLAEAALFRVRLAGESGDRSRSREDRRARAQVVPRASCRTETPYRLAMPPMVRAAATMWTPAATRSRPKSSACPVRRSVRDRGLRASVSRSRPACRAGALPARTFRRYGESGGVCFSRSSELSRISSSRGMPESEATCLRCVAFGTVICS